MRTSNATKYLVLGFLILLNLALFFIPAVITRPFSHQAARPLLVAMAVKQYAPLLTALSMLGILLLVGMLWRRVSLWKKAILVLGVCLAAGAAVMARVDYFEWMFHPLLEAGFEPAETSKLDPSEMVMAVSFNQEARAYPIREMAYHHVLNDIVGGVPVVATY